MEYSVYIAHNSGDMSPLTPHSPTQRWADALLLGALDPHSSKVRFQFYVHIGGRNGKPSKNYSGKEKCQTKGGGGVRQVFFHNDNLGKMGCLHKKNPQCML